jgi:hypothetical protein
MKKLGQKDSADLKPIGELWSKQIHLPIKVSLFCSSLPDSSWSSHMDPGASGCSTAFQNLTWRSGEVPLYMMGTPHSTTLAKQTQAHCRSWKKGLGRATQRLLSPQKSEHLSTKSLQQLTHSKVLNMGVYSSANQYLWIWSLQSELWWDTGPGWSQHLHVRN